MATVDDEEAIFNGALDRERPQDRITFLDRACAGNTSLRRRIEQLLSAYDEAGCLEPPTCILANAISPLIHEKPGVVIGAYKLLEQIGEGGMGLVFMAEQSYPLRRRVALKIIKPGLDTRAVIARFEAERQALALMDHPNIARVYDAGATESGRPYFVMELVRGLPITEYCLKRHLPLGDRLDLFIQVCEAVQHAHQKGIIHRDLKPTNILVSQSDTRPVPKVIDFGVAKATTGPLTEKTLFTAFSQIIGTPLYMSPEQADLGNQDVDTRSDVYSLAVVLYELLTGTTPFEPSRFQSVGPDEMRRIIREEEPPKPSTRATTAALGAQSTVASTPHPPGGIQVAALKGDLDWIVMKALQKDRRGRYDSPSALADDIQRCLENEPVLARPPSYVDQLGKWSRRHVRLVWSVLAASLMVAIASGVSAILIGESRDEADKQRQNAVDERNTAKQERNIALVERNGAKVNEYYSEIVSSQFDLDHGNISRLDQKLIQHLPVGDELDRRGWEWFYLFSHCHPETRTLYFPGYGLYAQWSPDGRHIGSSGTIWRADSGECIRAFRPTLAAEYECAWSPDSKIFAFGTLSDSGAIYLWDRETDQLRVLPGNEASIWPLDFSPDGSKLASGATDGKVKVWNVATGAIVRTIDFNSAANITSLSWSPDGELLAVGRAWNAGVSIHDAATGNQVHHHKIVGVSRTRAEWSPDGRQLAINSSSRWLILNREDWTTVVEHAHPTGSGSDSVGIDIRWNPAGSTLAYSERANIVIWDPKKDVEVRRFVGHREPVQSLSWRPDGRQLLSSDRSYEIRVWDLDSALQPPEIPVDTPLERLSWESAGGELLAVAKKNFSATLWNAVDATRIKQDMVGIATLDPTMVFSPDRRRIARPVDDSNRERIEILDADTGDVQAVYATEAPFASMTIKSPPRSFYSERGGMAWSPDGAKLAVAIVADTEAGLEVWDVASERRLSRWVRPRIKNLEGHSDANMRLLTWSPDGQRIAAVGLGDGGDSGGTMWLSRLHVIDVETGHRLLKHALGRKSKDGGDITSVAWSPDSRYIAAGTNEGYIDVADIKSRKRVMACKPYDFRIRALAWSPDGSRLASAADDGFVKLLESNRGNELLSLRVGDKSVKQLAWSPDGRKLAAANDERIHIWDATRGYAFAEGGSRQAELAWMYFQSTDKRGTSSIADRRVIELAPKALDYRWLRGSAFVRMDQFDEAAREFAAARPKDLWQGLLFAHREIYAYLGARNVDAYRDLLAKIMKSAGEMEVQSHHVAAYWLACLIPDAQVDFEPFLSDIQESIAARPEYASSYSLSIGAAQYRKGQFAKCNEELTSLATKLESVSPPDNYPLAVSKLFLAMARERLGEKAQAVRLLREATLARDRLKDQDDTRWTSLVEVNAILREAQAMIEH